MGDGYDEADTTDMMKQTLKTMLPDPLWNYGRNKYNRVRYWKLWKNRRVVTFDRSGATIALVIVNPTDSIQRVQAGGRFYEEDELAAIASYFLRGGCFVDIGANTGQHAIYFCKVLGASSVVLFEPIPEACKILRENIRLNDMNSVCDLSFLGFGLSDRYSRANFSVHTENLGGTSLHEDESGSIKTITGDSALSDRKVDFIKIDTEGFEIKVLRGLTETIRSSRPTIYVEVDNKNLAEFQEFLSKEGYAIELRHKRYKGNENFLATPRAV
jgi:FkbM family methyltransferase